MRPHEAAAEDPAETRRLPPDLPVPEDDGAADHLPGLKLPAVSLPSTGGGQVDLAGAAKETLILYVYPQTGVPGRPSPPGWDQIPGARGCTPESCGFCDHVAELAAPDAGVLGLSSQAAGEQREFAARERIPFPLLSDPSFRLAEALRLPTFEVAGRRYYRRLTLVARRRTIVKVFYPVFPPDAHAAEVVAWLRRAPSAGRSRRSAVREDRVSVLRSGYAAFNERDIERALQMLDPDVEWPNMMDGTTLHGHDAVREEPFIDAVRRGIESGAFTPRFDTAAIVEVVVANIVGLLYPVVLGHLAPQDTDYRDIVLAQLAFVLTTSTQNASGTPLEHITQER